MVSLTKSPYKCENSLKNSVQYQHLKYSKAWDHIDKPVAKHCSLIATEYPTTEAVGGEGYSTRKVKNICLRKDYSNTEDTVELLKRNLLNLL